MKYSTDFTYSCEYGDSTVKLFDSMTMAGGAFEANRSNWRNDDLKWRGSSAKGVLKAMMGGNDKYAARIEEFQRGFDLPDISGVRKRRVKGTFGPQINLTQAYDGNPVCFVRRDRVRDVLAPLNVMFDATVSGGLSVETMERRGAAILTLVQQLQQIRPVTLNVCAGMRIKEKNTMLAVRVDIDPVDLARAGWIVCSPAFLRQFAFSICGETHETDGVRWIYEHHTWQQNDMLGVLGGYMGRRNSGTALELAGRYLTDGDFEDDESARKWVQETLAAHSD